MKSPIAHFFYCCSLWSQKKCVNLPIVNTKDDEWYCDRLVNEAVIELTRNEYGPVQINFHINQSIDDIADASENVLPKYRKIEWMTVRDMRKWDFAQKKNIKNLFKKIV